jgi:hypothetical protein
VPSPVGYSGTPLARKLGIRPGVRWLVSGKVPGDYADWVAPLPEGASIVGRARGPHPAVHVFTDRRSDLERRLVTLRKSIEEDGFVWVSWPKRTSGVPTDVTEDVVRSVALPLGFVDIKVCAVSEVWSGLKLVIRREARRPKQKHVLV